MKIYLLERIDHDSLYSWNITVGEVIVAENKDEALGFSEMEADAEISIKEIGIANEDIEKGKILEDYKNG